MKEILVVSHCILNNASKVAQDESELAREYMERDELMRAVMDRGVQLLQLPCPEFTLYGSARWGHVKDQFDNPFFRNHCRDILKPILDQLTEYSSYPEKFEILGIVSVEGSPSCGHNLTCRAEWGGELGACDFNEGGPASSARMTDEAGVFMEVLEDMLAEHQLDIPIVSISGATEITKQKNNQ